MKILALFNCNQAVEKLQRDFSAAGGYELAVCDTILSALQYLENESPDVVMCQMHLNGEDICDFLRALNSHETASHIPVIGCYVEASDLESNFERELDDDPTRCNPEKAMRAYGHSKFVQPQTFYSYFLKHEVIDFTRKVHADPVLIARPQALTA
jgi:CheY-like chemotaxis protein